MRVDRGDRRRVRLPVDTLDDWFLARPYFLRHAHLVVIRNILRGVSAATTGLLIATGTRMLAPHRHHLKAMVVAALAVGDIGFARPSLLVVLFSLAPLSIAVTAFVSARAQ